MNPSHDDWLVFGLLLFIVINISWCLVWMYEFIIALLYRDGKIIAHCNDFGEGWYEVFMFLSMVIMGVVLIWKIVYPMVCR
jgi:hypothetical protein